MSPEIITDHADRVSRAPTDVLRLVVGVAVLAATMIVLWLAGDDVIDAVGRFSAGLEVVPDGLVSALALLAQVLGIVVLVGTVGLATARRHWLLLAALALALVAGAGLYALLDPEPTGVAVVDVDTGLTLFDPALTLSFAGLAAVTAAVTAVAPWVGRRLRRAGWALVMLLGGVAFLATPIAADALVAIEAGWVAGAATVVALGAPSRRPTGASIAAGLAAVGLPVSRLEQASLDTRGSTPYFADAEGGGRLFVKALGEDERSADLLFRAYRRLQPTDLGDEKAFSTLRRAVEHEALVALAARDLGVRTPRLLAVSTAEPKGIVLAYEAIPGRSLDRLEPAEVTDDVLADVWGQVVVLRHRRVAHRDLRLANVFLGDDGHAWLIDFGFAELAASDLLLATDVAELLASSASLVGIERAVGAGRAALGDDLSSAAPRLRRPMLSGATRSALEEQPDLLDRLRHAVEHPGGPTSLDP